MAENETTIAFTPSKELFPFESRWFESAAGRVHYVDEGSGRPILFLHGNPTWSFLYRGIIGQLRDQFRCIAVDYPGFGLSARPPGYGYTPREHAEVVTALVEQLDLRELIVMGQDWGGPIGIATALAAPERVSGLVFGNTWFWPTDRFMNSVFSVFMSSPPMRWAILQRNFFVERLIPAGTARKLSQEEMDHYRGVQPDRDARAGVAEFPRQLRTAAPFLAELARRVPDVLAEKPLLLVWGMKDFAFRPNWAIPRWQATFKDVVLLELPDARHFIQEDAPDEIAAAIRERFGSAG
ncbi:MAG: alpha/beta fold hydrolase [Chloroflexi bacterium]|nr:alpha/beta fold hydrolase [Chloroflexota bacterium]